jgi:hypothetical protein
MRLIMAGLILAIRRPEATEHVDWLDSAPPYAKWQTAAVRPPQSARRCLRGEGAARQRRLPAGRIIVHTRLAGHALCLQLNRRGRRKS